MPVTRFVEAARKATDWSNATRFVRLAVLRSMQKKKGAVILIKNDAVNLKIEHFRTRRMVAERLTAGDFEDIRRLHLQPEVMMTLSVDCETLPDKAIHEELDHDVAHWEQHGFGLWVFRDIKDAQFLGRGGLKWYRINDKDVVALDYAVTFDHWNRGLATEIAQASLTIGFDRLSFPEISCWALPINYASLRVMEKVGFRYQEDLAFAGLQYRFCRLTAAEWKRKLGKRAD